MEQQEFAKHLRHRMTDSENKLWRHLRAHRLNGKKFRRQQPIGPYVVDFVHFGARLIVEADGGQHNDAPHDERRDAWLRTQGFKVLRFWNNEIMSNLDGVLITVMAALNELPPPLPNPSPARGEGLLMPLPNPSPARGEGRFPSREKTCPSNP
jgi:very-short-patch-repair endonuclease